MNLKRNNFPKTLMIWQSNIQMEKAVANKGAVSLKPEPEIPTRVTTVSTEDKIPYVRRRP